MFGTRATDPSDSQRDGIGCALLSTHQIGRGEIAGPAAQLYEHRNVSRLFNITFKFLYFCNVFFGDNMSEQKGSRTENNEWKDIGK